MFSAGGDHVSVTDAVPVGEIVVPFPFGDFLASADAKVSPPPAARDSSAEPEHPASADATSTAKIRPLQEPDHIGRTRCLRLMGAATFTAQDWRLVRRSGNGVRWSALRSEPVYGGHRKVIHRATLKTRDHVRRRGSTRYVDRGGKQSGTGAVADSKSSQIGQGGRVRIQ